jgi:hypothetical protein
VKIACLSNSQVSVDSDTQATETAENGSGVAIGSRLPRVMPPLPFEAEEFHSQIPEENWRHRPGLPQTLDFPSIRT